MIESERAPLNMAECPRLNLWLEQVAGRTPWRAQDEQRFEWSD
jgi:hypothetical protein